MSHTLVASCRCLVPSCPVVHEHAARAAAATVPVREACALQVSVRRTGDGAHVLPLPCAAGSLQQGTVSASERRRSLLWSKRPSALARAIGALRRIPRTLYMRDRRINSRRGGSRECHCAVEYALQGGGAQASTAGRARRHGCRGRTAFPPGASSH